MKKFLVIIFSIFILLLALVGYFYKTGEIIIVSSNQLNELNTGSLHLTTIENQNYSSISVNTTEDFGASANNLDYSTYANLAAKNETDAILPDFESFECGFYFQKYGVCAGRCPKGDCVSEGRSCYCKLL